MFIYALFVAPKFLSSTQEHAQIAAGVLRGFSTQTWQFYLSAFVDMGTRSEEFTNIEFTLD